MLKVFNEQENALLDSLSNMRGFQRSKHPLRLNFAFAGNIGEQPREERRAEVMEVLMKTKAAEYIDLDVLQYNATTAELAEDILENDGYDRFTNGFRGFVDKVHARRTKTLPCMAYVDYEPKPRDMGDGTMKYFQRGEWFTHAEIDVCSRFMNEARIAQVYAQLPFVKNGLWALPKPKVNNPEGFDRTVDAQTFAQMRMLNDVMKPDYMIANFYQGSTLDEYGYYRFTTNVLTIMEQELGYPVVPCMQFLERGAAIEGTKPMTTESARGMGKALQDLNVENVMIWYQWNDPRQEAAAPEVLDALIEGYESNWG